MRTRTPSDAGGMVEGAESPGGGARTPPPRRSTAPPAELFSLQNSEKAVVFEKVGRFLSQVAF